jgi:hypothetical protein
VLRQVAEGVLIHESEFCQSNAVVVHGRAGVLLIDPGCRARPEKRARRDSRLAIGARHNANSRTSHQSRMPRSSSVIGPLPGFMLSGSWLNQRSTAVS